MSYENHPCPCGGKKLIETMLCVECEQSFAGCFDRRCSRSLCSGCRSRRFSIRIDKADRLPDFNRITLFDSECQDAILRCVENLVDFVCFELEDLFI